MVTIKNSWIIVLLRSPCWNGYFFPFSLFLSLSLRRGLSPKIFGEWNFLGALLLSIRTGRCVAFHIRSASIAIIQHSRRIESLLAPPHFLPSPLGPVSRNDISQTGHNFSAQERERSDSCFYFFLKRNGILLSRVFIPSKGSQFGFLDGIRFSTVNSLNRNAGIPWVSAMETESGTPSIDFLVIRYSCTFTFMSLQWREKKKTFERMKRRMKRTRSFVIWHPKCQLIWNLLVG